MSETEFANRLINEKSPYLIQHAHNPVDWFPWGDEAFKKAKTEDKPIFLSIGYSTCHWCHVMERESFEDSEVAEVLNRGFIAIKVDREERPDIDSVYMSVCQALTGSGGWPLTILMTPDREPFFAGTYFPKQRQFGVPGLIELLEQITKNWDENRQKLFQSAGEITRLLARQDKGLKEPSKQSVKVAVQTFARGFDKQYGGFGSAPKFPTPHNLMFLMRYHVFERDDSALDIVQKTLAQMYRGGLFDHVGGGFSRYSTDRMWLVPHFEKMLYDNALLCLAYLECYQLTGNDINRLTAERTLNYIKQEMTSPEGGFYSAQDADSEGVEGKYYLFTPNEVISVLGEKDGAYLNGFYNITEQGNFEGGNILNLINNDEYNKWDEHLQKLCQKLYDYRLARVSLLKDDKILTSWNALMICAYAKAYQVIGNEEYRAAAENALRFIEEKLTDKSGRLMVRYRDGQSTGTGFLDDYAFTAWAYLSMYEATFDINFLKKAKTCAKAMINLFYDTENGGFFLYAEDSERLIHRPKETYDGAMPSGNSAAGLVLTRLKRITDDQTISDVADKQLAFLENSLSQYPSGFTLALMAEMQELYGGKELMCVIPDKSGVNAIKDSLRDKFIPNVTVIIKTPENSDQLADIAEFTKDYEMKDGTATYYLCQNRACSAPLADLNQIMDML